MSKKTACVDCECHAVSRSTKRHTRFVISEVIVFSCGARRTEHFDSEAGVGSVQFEGCSCGT